MPRSPFNRKSLAIPLLAAALAAGGCSAKRDHVEPPAKLTEFSASFQPKEIWSSSSGAADSSGQLALAPFVDQGILVTLDPRGTIAAYDSATGATRWKHELGFAAAGGVGGGSGLVVVSGREGEIAALDLDSGAQRWKVETGSLVSAPASVGAGRVALRGADGRLMVLDAASGARQWVDTRPVPPLSLRGTGRTLLLEDAVIAGFDNGELGVYALNNGRKLFSVTVALPSGRSEVERMVDVDSTPLIDRGVIYALAYQGRLVAIDGAKAQILWARELSGFNDMAQDRKALYITDAKGQVMAIDKRTGSPLWTQSALRARGVTGPTLVKDALVVGDMEGYLHWLSTEDGRPLARLRPLSGAVISAPRTDGERIFVQGRDGRVAAVEGRPGG
ncbi:MAG: outer membrane protein assembly factor BamB [Pseudomonadota bacterium]